MRLKHLPREGMGWLNAKAQIAALRWLHPDLSAGEPHTLPGRLVVSLTSHPPRFPALEIVLRHLLAQDMRPDDVILWLARGDARRLPRGVRALVQQAPRFAIRECEDVKSYNKIIPALDAYPDAFIVTADDDIRYPRSWLRTLVAAWRGRDEILCQRARRVTLDRVTECLAPYRQWAAINDDGARGPEVFPTGTHGVLYPPGALAPETTDAAQFMRLAPHADDVWLYWMGLAAGSTPRLVKPVEPPSPLPSSRSASLWRTHNIDGGNDRQIAAMLAAYGLPRALEGVVTPH